MSKWAVAILAGLFFFVPIGLGQSPDQAAKTEQDSWKTYQSQWYTFEGPDGVLTARFTIKYPADWFVVWDNPEGVVLATFTEDEERQLDQLKLGDLVVYAGAHTDTATHGEWVERKSDNPVTLWFTGCRNPLSVDLFVTKEDPNLEKNKDLLLKIAGTFQAETRP